MDFQVIAGTSYWAMNGINVFSANLVRGMHAKGIPARILMTEQNCAMVHPPEPMMPLPADIPIDNLPQSGLESWGSHWGAMIRYLEERAPCVYLPNHDWRHSNVCSQLSPEVRVAGVVHSDDPLHYDHVARLGRYWDAIVTTTDAIASRVIAANPGVAARVRTIPIGVPVPTLKARGDLSKRPLRLLYHGGLIQYQKRVLDLPKIVEAALGLGVPVDLTLFGDGADRDRLAAAGRRLIESGAMRLAGVVAHADLMEAVGQFDVYLLASEFEGMPNALGEAMAGGCVPIATNIRSGVRELVRDGENGFIVPVGDIAAFADRLAILYADPVRRAAMSERARSAVITGGFDVGTMVERYQKLFGNLIHPAKTDVQFARPPGILRLPPYQVGRIKLFELAKAYRFEGVGILPSASVDYKGYARELNGVGGRWFAPRPKKPQVYPRVLVSATSGRLSGVDIFSANLVRGLRARGRDAHVLMTCPHDSTPDPLPFPDDIPVKRLPSTRHATWNRRWRSLGSYLEKRAPCIYIPNYDWRHSCISPTLSAKVAIVGIVHSDDPLHYEHASRLGPYWNAIVAVSRRIADRVIEQNPALAPRVVTIPYGVDVPRSCPPRDVTPGRPLRIVYAGRLVEAQKRVLDLPRIFGRLIDRGVAAELTIIGAGEQEPDLRAACRPWIESGKVCFRGTLPNQEVVQILRESDVFVLTSAFEGLPVSLLEAMAQGCVPVVTDIPSGIPEVVRHGETGYRLGVGDVGAFTNCIADLATRAAFRNSLSEAAHKMIRNGDYSVEDMAAAYMGLFERVLVQAELGEYRRPAGEVLPSPDGPGLNSRQPWPGWGFLRRAATSIRTGLRSRHKLPGRLKEKSHA